MHGKERDHYGDKHLHTNSITSVIAQALHAFCISKFAEILSSMSLLFYIPPMEDIIFFRVIMVRITIKFI